jgi:two-component system, OmpR family, sensor histidine kinase BaeS
VKTPATQPLSVRLALLLSVAVVSVLLVTGLAVNRLVAGPLEAELSAVQQDRLTVVAGALGDVNWSTPRGRTAIRVVLRRVALAANGRASLVDASGTTVLSEGSLPAGAGSQQVSEPIAGGGSLVVEVPSPDRPFLRVFNLTLLGAGLLAVAALVGVAVFLSDRLTRPLRGVTQAARRLGAGDLAARASGGSDRESAELADAFNAMADRLQRSEMLRRRAASDMAHDLATPATVLESQLQAMVDGVVPTDPTQLDQVRAAAGALSGVIGQMRELVDAESALLSRRAGRVEIVPMLAELEQAMQPLFRERGLTLVTEPLRAGLAGEFDETQVVRALRNVLTNAAQHSPAAGEVRVSLEAGPHDVHIRVRDHGSGIAAADLPHLFERFYRADPARGPAVPRPGSGIGLTIALELLAANDGGIEVESTGPQGTTFRVRLPRTA